MLLSMYQIFSSLLSQLPFSIYFFLHFYGVTFFATPNINSFFKIRPRISTRGCVSRSVGPLVRPSVRPKNVISYVPSTKFDMYKEKIKDNKKN